MGAEVLITCSAPAQGTAKDVAQRAPQAAEEVSQKVEQLAVDLEAGLPKVRTWVQGLGLYTSGAPLTEDARGVCMPRLVDWAV